MVLPAGDLHHADLPEDLDLPRALQLPRPDTCIAGDSEAVFLKG